MTVVFFDPASQRSVVPPPDVRELLAAAVVAQD